MKIEIEFDHTDNKITATYSDVDPPVSPEEITVTDNPFKIIVGNESEKFQCILQDTENPSMLIPYKLEEYIFPIDWIVRMADSDPPGNLHTIIDNAPDDVRITEV